jgi:hypothetical protein
VARPEAKERLGEIVEGFFFPRRDGESEPPEGTAPPLS